MLTLQQAASYVLRSYVVSFACASTNVNRSLTRLCLRSCDDPSPLRLRYVLRSLCGLLSFVLAMLHVVQRQPGPPIGDACIALLPLPSVDEALLAYVTPGAVVLAPLKASSRYAPQVLRVPACESCAVHLLLWAPGGGALLVVAGARAHVYAWEDGYARCGGRLSYAGCVSEEAGNQGLALIKGALALHRWLRACARCR